MCLYFLSLIRTNNVSAKLNTIGQSSAGIASGTIFSEIPLNASVISATIIDTPANTIVIPTPKFTPEQIAHKIAGWPPLNSASTYPVPAIRVAITYNKVITTAVDTVISFKKFNFGFIFKSSEVWSLYLLNKLPTIEPTTTPVVVVCPYANASEPVTILP